MLTAYLFDKRRGKEIEEWRDTVAGLTENQVLDLPSTPQTTKRTQPGKPSTADADRLRLGDAGACAETLCAETHIRVVDSRLRSGERLETRDGRDRLLHRRELGRQRSQARDCGDRRLPHPRGRRERASPRRPRPPSRRGRSPNSWTCTASARDAKDAVVNSFDVLILRTEHRTNEIVKVLTLASILLLPGALIAGVMGMNVNFSAATFAHSPLFGSC